VLAVSREKFTTAQLAPAPPLKPSNQINSPLQQLDLSETPSVVVDDLRLVVTESVSVEQISRRDLQSKLN
jgi:hypothetical protein